MKKVVTPSKAVKKVQPKKVADPKPKPPKTGTPIAATGSITLTGKCASCPLARPFR